MDQEFLFGRLGRRAIHLTMRGDATTVDPGGSQLLFALAGAHPPLISQLVDPAVLKKIKARPVGDAEGQVEHGTGNVIGDFWRTSA
jgi:hypothetical protein